MCGAGRLRRGEWGNGASSKVVDVHEQGLSVPAITCVGSAGFHAGSGARRSQPLAYPAATIRCVDDLFGSR